MNINFSSNSVNLTTESSSVRHRKYKRIVLRDKRCHSQIDYDKTLELRPLTPTSKVRDYF